MSNLLQLKKGYKSYGSRVLFEGASFSIDQDEHVGVIGPNGAGKTTLFRVLAGQEELDSGELTCAKNVRIGYLAQHDHWEPGQTVESYLTDGKDACITPICELKTLGRGLGLNEETFSRPVLSLSGGYRMRCKLLKLLGQEPDLLLLDEPTNYLDLESLIVLERFLQGYKGSFLLISHDREFLRRTTDHILEVEAGEITKYNGNLDDYFEQKALLRAQLEARALSIEEKKKTILDFVNRFGAKATKARQAQSRLKSLDRLESIEIKALPNTAAIKLPQPTRTGKLIIQMKDLVLGYGEKKVLSHVNLQLERGDHLAVVGVNGAGKSTFLKGIAGILKPLQGELKWGHEVSIGYYAQHVGEALNPNHTVIEAMGAHAHPEVLPQEVLNLAGSLLFSGDDAKKRVSVLSGGEKSRVALGQILLKKAPCLVLDEPTNHLDFQTVEALTEALMKYEGTVVVVSHDRSFIGRIGSKILEIRDGRAEVYPGSYEEYLWSMQKGTLAGRTAAPANAAPKPSLSPASASGSDRRFNYKESKKELDRLLKQSEKGMKDAEAKIESHQKRMQELNAKLISEPAAPEFKKWIVELGDLQVEVEKLESKWLELSEEREKAESEIVRLTQLQGPESV